MKRILFFIITGIILSLLLVACGGDDEEEPAEAPAAQPPAAETEKEEAPAAEGYQGGAVADGGTIEGKITYTGAAVEPEAVAVDKDQEVCGDTLNVLKVETDGSGGLANAVVRITDISSGKPLDSLGSEFVLDQKGCVYVPSVVIVPVGSSLKILNSDNILHNIHTTPFDNAPLNKAQPATQLELQSDVFTIPEFIPVGCDVHKWMNATIAVVDNPYAVVTGADGSFSLTDVPAGTYTVEVWHAELKSQTMSVTVEAGGTATANVEFK
jgi:plastocyanin